jgi:uncharacterized protein
MPRGGDPTAERRCIACGRIGEQSSFRRFAVDETGAVVADQRRELPSRGAYVCDDACLAAATKRRAWGRAFRRAVTPPGP